MTVRLAHYSSQINYIDVEGAITIMDCSFHLFSSEIDLLRSMLEKMKEIGQHPYLEIKEIVKRMKDCCHRDFQTYMKDETNFSEWNSRLLLEVLANREKSQERDQLVHTICRLGEFYYLSDEEMEGISENIDEFIDIGDCKLLDNSSNPYGPGYLKDDLIKDILEFETNIQKYNRENQLPELSALTIITALNQIKDYCRMRPSETPSHLMGYFQLFEEIRKGARSLIHEWDDGMQETNMMTKLSGSCLNKELQFRIFREKTKTSAWKNPETNMFMGNTNIKIPETVKKDLYYIPWWNMDTVYYSIGKGPWLKSRYVGQPATIFQNLCEPGARVVKSAILKHHKQWKRGEPGVWDAEGINIYDNYERLYRLIYTNKDFNSIDFESYSDYLSRDTFRYIMEYFWGFPKDYINLIMSIMALPIRVNGKDYENRHASVMGIKINFLLISFANLLMWMIYSLVGDIKDEVIIMGDDRQTGSRNYYKETDIKLQIAVSSYFNCKSNLSKCEWTHRDGYSSFCKRYFNSNKEQISGFSGEYILKQKPFMLDISNWMKLCKDGEIKITKDDQSKWINYWLPYIETTYYKFYRKDDPELTDLFSVQLKIPYYYGGLAFQDPDDAIEKILLRSLLASINSILEYAGEDLQDPNRKKIRGWIKANCRSPVYYDVLYRISSFDKDWDRVRDCIERVEAALVKVTSYDAIQRARVASQQLTEIVLQRDSRMANSTSTKNRIDYCFDQDRISKIRKIYLDASLAEKEFYVESNLVDHAVFNQLMESKNNLAIPDYLNYLRIKSLSKCGLAIYSNWTRSFLAMTVPRGDKTFYKRLTSNDSAYDHIYRDLEGNYQGSFVNYEDLTEEEKEVYQYYQKKSTRKVIYELDNSLNRQVDSLTNYLINVLAELYVK